MKFKLKKINATNDETNDIFEISEIVKATDINGNEVEILKKINTISEKRIEKQIEKIQLRIAELNEIKNEIIKEKDKNKLN